MSIPVKGIYRSSCSIFLTSFHIPRKHCRNAGKIEPNKVSVIREHPDSRSKNDAFPIPIAFAILIIWIVLSAALFCLWERQWGFMTSVYFFFVSISTVGLGDIIPSNKDMMLANFVLILFGLALLSMCFNVIQITVERMLDQFLQQCFEEIEKVANLINKQGDIEDSVCSPSLEEKPWSLTNQIKEWLASQVANKLISSKLELHKYDSDSDDETDYLSDPKSAKFRQEARLLRHGHWLAFKFQKNPSLLKALGMLRRFKDLHDKEHFKSVLFFKFITNEKFDQLLTNCCDDDGLNNISDSEQKNSAYNSTGKNAPSDSEVLSERSSWENDMQMIKFDGSRSTFDIESIYSKAYNDIQFGDSYTSFWGNPENSSELLQYSEASLDFISEVAPNRSETGVSVKPIEAVAKVIPQPNKSEEYSTPTNLHRYQNQNLKQLSMDQRLNDNNVTSKSYCKSLSKPIASTDEPILSRVRNVVGIMPDDFRKPPFSF